MNERRGYVGKIERKLQNLIKSKGFRMLKRNNNKIIGYAKEESRNQKKIKSFSFACKTKKYSQKDLEAWKNKFDIQKN